MDSVETVDLSVLLRWRMEVPRHLQAIGLGLFEVGCPTMAVPKHRHETAFFCMLLDGDFESDYGHARLPYRASSIVFHPAGTMHTSLVGRQGARLLTVEATPDWIARAEAYGVMPRGPAPLGRQDGLSARRLLRELRHSTPCSLLAIEGLVLEMLAGAARRRREDPGSPIWLDRARELVCSESHLPLTLTAIAARVGAEPAQLSSSFRSRFGQSLGDYLRTLRVERVCDALRTDRPLAEIALAAGFADQAHCTRIFKRQTGVTPGAYRRALRDRRGSAAPRRILATRPAAAALQ